MKPSVEIELNRAAAPLVFVFLGATFPSYGIASLRLAVATTPNPVVVLAEVPRISGVPSTVEWTEISSFYADGDFHNFVLAPPFKPGFRDGFWLKTAERLFVVRSYMEHQKLGAVYHGELDCLFFGLDDLEREIIKTGLEGVFIPRETTDRCIASLIYINNQRAMDELCDFLIRNSQLGNEMDILGALPHGRDSNFYAFPTAEALFRDGHGATGQQWPIQPVKPSFLVDGAVLGRWVFGVDPRNTHGRGTKNRLQEHKYGVPFHHPLRELSLSFSSANHWRVTAISPEGKRFQVACLHVHSKIHAKLTTGFLVRVFRRLERGKATVIVPIYPRFVAQTIGRITTQIRLSVRSPQKFLALAKNMLSIRWWTGLRRRLLDL